MKSKPKSKSKRKSTGKCESCGVEWTKHPGVSLLCEALAIALARLAMLSVWSKYDHSQAMTQARHNLFKRNYERKPCTR